MKSIALLVLLLGVSCLAGNETLVPALSDDVLVVEGSRLLIADGTATLLTLRDGRGKQVILYYPVYIDPKTAHHDQFGVRAAANEAATFLAKGSEDEKALLRLVVRAYQNTFGAPDRDALIKGDPPPADTTEEWKHRSAWYVLRAAERRQHMLETK